MAFFDNHKITVSNLLEVIPEDILTNLSTTTKVDHYAKTLQGRKMFYLLMYGVLENERLSQRTLEDTFNDPVFKLLFDLDEEEKIRRSSISERLSKINPDYFKQIYDCIYQRFSKFYSLDEREKYNLIRVDSSMVAESVGKLLDGMSMKGKKYVKYGVAFDGVLPCDVNIFTTSSYSSEDVSLPEVVMNHVKKSSHHKNIYLLDRGLQSARTMSAFSSDAISFICRIKENRKHIELESLIKENQDLDLGDSTLVKDSIIQLYTGVPMKSKTGIINHKEKLVHDNFRLVIVESKAKEGNRFWFLTNNFDLSAKEIAQAYRKRWDIEVFFRFIKQELNVSHLVSMNRNGMQVIIYMTLIVAMLVLIYKKENSLSYKTAKRRFSMEIRDVAIALIVVQCGGDPKLFLKHNLPTMTT